MKNAILSLSLALVYLGMGTGLVGCTRDEDTH